MANQEGNKARWRFTVADWPRRVRSWVVGLIVFSVLLVISYGPPIPTVRTIQLAPELVSLIGLVVFTLTAFICYTLVQAHHTPLNALGWSLLPPLVLLCVASIFGSLALVLVTVIAVAGSVAELVYSRYVIAVLIDDIGVVAPLTVTLLVYPFNVPRISETALVQFYGVILQSALVLVGLVFTIGLFLAEGGSSRDSLRGKNMLKGFLSLFIALSIVSAVGLLTSRDTLILSREALFVPTTQWSHNTVMAVALVGTLCLFLVCVMYLLIVFKVFVGGMESQAEGGGKAS